MLDNRSRAASANLRAAVQASMQRPEGHGCACETIGPREQASLRRANAGPPHAWHTQREVADYLHVWDGTVRRLVKAGKLPCVRIVRCVRIQAGDVLAFTGELPASWRSEAAGGLAVVLSGTPEPEPR